MFQFMWESRCAMAEGTLDLELMRENNCYMMEEFIKAGYRGEKLASLNRCRILLLVITLSDLLTGDRGEVVETTLKGVPTGCPTHLHWPRQGQVSKKRWKKWEEAIRETFQIQRAMFLLLHLCPRKWLDKKSNTGWKYSPRTDEMVKFSNGK
eukprot:8021605-Ditylum_brightwellii.AAC.1